jgi:hypothetical protein
MRTPQPPVPGGFGFPFGVALAVVAAFGAVAAGAAGQPVLSLVAMVAVVDVIALASTTGATLATAAVCWSLQAGFVLGRHGDLVFTAQSGHDALVLGLSALAGIAFASTVRATRTPLHEREHDPKAPVIPAQRPRPADTLVKNA